MNIKSKNLLFYLTIILFLSSFVFCLRKGHCLSASLVLESNKIQNLFETEKQEKEFLMSIFWQESSFLAQGIKDLMVIGLEKKGYRIKIIEKVNEKTIVDDNPPVAILNPDSAKELSVMLKSLNPDIRIVITSGYLLTENDVKTMGGDYFLQKPPKIDGFLKLLKKIKSDIDLGIKHNKNNNFQLPEASEYEVVRLDEYPQIKEKLKTREFEYRRRLLRRKKDGALFFIKTCFQPSVDKQGNFIYPKKNDPSREYSAFKIGRYFKANVCDIVLPTPKQSKMLAKYIGALEEDIYLVRLSSDYLLNNQQVMQKNLKRAFTRNLVLSVLLRKYDFHSSNYSSIADSQVSMMFDNDQSFHEELQDIDKFTFAFMENFFPSFKYNVINAMQLLEFVSVKELMEAVLFSESEFDTQRIQQEMQHDQFQHFMDSFSHLSYVKRTSKSLRKDMLEFFNKIFSFKQRYDENSMEFFVLDAKMQSIKEALEEKRPSMTKRPQIKQKNHSLVELAI